MKQKSEKRRKYKIDNKEYTIKEKVPKSFQEEFHKEKRKNGEEETNIFSWEISRTFKDTKLAHLKKQNKQI